MQTPRYLLVAAGLLLASCDLVATGEEPFEQQYVVEAYQVAGEPLQQVRLSRTAPVNTTYDFTALAVRGATVRIQLLGADGEPERAFDYSESEIEPGVYLPRNAVTVLPLRTYALDVTTAGDDRLAARTFVPDTFRVVGASAESIPYQGEAQLELEVTRSAYPGRQSVYLFTTEALEAREDMLTPFARALYEDGDLTLESLRISSSPLLNEANYDVNERGNITIQLPWLAVAFYGPNRVTASVIDGNLYDFLRSQNVQQGGSTLSPGEIPNVIDHIDGGTGVFASLAHVSYEVLVSAPDEAAQ